MRADRQDRDEPVRHGDEALYAWGEAKRNRELEALLEARCGGLNETGKCIRSPGTYSNPPLAVAMIADQYRLRTAFTLDNEIERWRRQRSRALWAAIADQVYASPYSTTNAEAARALWVSTSQVSRARTQMRKAVMDALALARREPERRSAMDRPVDDPQQHASLDQVHHGSEMPATCSTAQPSAMAPAASASTVPATIANADTTSQ